ncbi:MULTISPECIES: class I adenylate-forming enzyme family protein [unclassified Ruegeria]|uniref:AMP-binding protein n=1 Tax=unclassified Ruegeria TaxID=2625375 RepID=UPI001489F8A2|nr:MULTISPECIES: class I adenylate-forming enzyme family protein [unclassified Ruegeria]
MILHDQTTPDFLHDLSRMWQPGTPSFALLPHRFDQDSAWVEACVQALPETLRTDHVLLATSGSTGAPKLLVASRLRAEAIAVEIGQMQGVAPGDTAIMTLPLSYCFSFVNQWVLAQKQSLNRIFARLSDPDHFAKVLGESERGLLCLVAAQVPLLSALGEVSFHKIKTVAFAGSPFPWAQSHTLARLFPNARFFDNYGCAEAMPRLTIADVTAHVQADTTPPLGQLGTPLTRITLRSSDSGELQFQSPYAALGSVAPEGYTPFAPDGWIATGDRAEQDSSGHWQLLGRTSEVFKRHGEKISLLRLRETIETVWDQEFVLAPAKDRSGEPGVQLFLAGSADRAAARTILQRFRAAHPRAHWPLQIIRVDKLPRLSNSKIDLLALETLPDQEILWDQRV